MGIIINGDKLISRIKKRGSHLIKVENLSKEFKISKKYPGFKGALRSFFSTEYTIKIDSGKKIYDGGLKVLKNNLDI